MPPERIKNLRELPQFCDGLSYLYVEQAVVGQEHGAVMLYRAEEVVAIPAAALGVLILGPGTTITHAAVKTLCDRGCAILWVGEDGTRFYASGLGETRSSARFIQQVRAWADPHEHMEVVMRLYRLRFREPLPEGLSLRQIRGLEGARVRDIYARCSRETGVPWQGRKYQRGNWLAADAVNRAISVGTSILYGVCHAAIVSLGYSPALGFIHTGKMLSLVYDVADLYKADLVVPAAFEAVAQGPAGAEERTRKTIRAHIRAGRLLERVAEDLLRLFEGLGGMPQAYSEDELFAEDGAAPGPLWDPQGQVQGGVNYGGDDPGEGAAGSKR